MTVKDLLDVYDKNRIADEQYLEVVSPGGDWNDYDTLVTSSSLLILIEKCEILTMGAEHEDCIRIEIDWSDIKYG